MKIINNKIFKTLVILFVFGCLLGIISFIFCSSDVKYNITNNAKEYVGLLDTSKINYAETMFLSFKYSASYGLYIFILGILFVFSFIIPLLIIFKGILFSFSVFSIIYVFNIKGVLYALILMFPYVINMILYLLLSYYSINLSIRLYKVFKNDKLINIRTFFKKYLYIYLIFNLFLLISSLIETFISSNILKFVV